MPDIVRVHDGERIERSDFEFVSETGQKALEVVPANVLMDTGGLRSWVVSGFDMTNPSAKQLRVARGVALVNRIENGALFAGAVICEGEVNRTLDLAAYANGTYGIYVRIEFADGEYQNRIFWNDAVPTEYTDVRATRRVVTWGLRAELTAPASIDWMKIGEVTVSGSPTLTIDKQRKFYFEGDENGAYAATISDSPTSYRVWGGGSDRDNDRGRFGVHDLQTFVAAVRSQLADIIGGDWFTAIADPLDNKVSRTGDLGMVGNYRISGGTLRMSGNINLDANIDIVNNTGAANQNDVGSATGYFDTMHSRLFRAYADATGGFHVTGTAANPKVIIEQTGAASLFGAIQFVTATLGAAVFYDGSIGRMLFNIETSNTSKFDFGFEGTTFLSIADNAAVSNPLNALVTLTGDFVGAGGGYIGGSAAYWTRAYITTVYANLVRPTTDDSGELGTGGAYWAMGNINALRPDTVASGNAGSIGVSSAQCYDILHVNRVRTYSSSQVPTTQAEMVELNQRKGILALCTLTSVGGAASPTLNAPHFNILSATHTGTGEWTLQLDENPNAFAVPLVCLGNNTHSAITSAEVQGAGVVVITIRNVAGAVVDLSAGAVISFLLVGSPETLLT